VKKIVMAVAALLLVSVFYAAPAHAVVIFDIDTVTLQSSGGNDQFKGKVNSFHEDGRVRARLTGDFYGRGTLRARWFFSDGTNQVDSKYTNGVNQEISFTSSSVRDVVRFSFTYERNAGGTDTASFFVGDSPDSTGTCDQIDKDTVRVTRANAILFGGQTRWTCAVQGQTYGTLVWDDAVGSNVQRFRIRVVYTYMSGLSEELRSPSIGRGDEPRSTGILRNQSGDARAARLFLEVSTDGTNFVTDGEATGSSVKLGDL